MSINKFLMNHQQIQVEDHDQEDALLFKWKKLNLIHAKFLIPLLPSHFYEISLPAHQSDSSEICCISFKFTFYPLHSLHNQFQISLWPNLRKHRSFSQIGRQYHHLAWLHEYHKMRPNLLILVNAISPHLSVLSI